MIIGIIVVGVVVIGFLLVGIILIGVGLFVIGRLALRLRVVLAGKSGFSVADQLPDPEATILKMRRFIIASTLGTLAVLAAWMAGAATASFNSFDKCLASPDTEYDQCTSHELWGTILVVATASLVIAATYYAVSTWRLSRKNPQFGRTATITVRESSRALWIEYCASIPEFAFERLPEKWKPDLSSRLFAPINWD